MPAREFCSHRHLLAPATTITAALNVAHFEHVKNNVVGNFQVKIKHDLCFSIVNYVYEEQYYVPTPKENWDDDFEFQGDTSSDNGSRTSKKISGTVLFTPKLSIGSRAEMEDRDADEDAGATPRALPHSAQLATSTSTLKPQMLSPASSSCPPFRCQIASGQLQAASHADEPPESGDDDLALDDAEFGLADHEHEGTVPAFVALGIPPPPSRMGSAAQAHVKRRAGAEVGRRRGVSSGPGEVTGGSHYTDASNDPSDTLFTNHDSDSSYSHRHLPWQPHAANKHPYDHQRLSVAPPNSPPSQSAPSQSPRNMARASSHPPTHHHRSPHHQLLPHPAALPRVPGTPKFETIAFNGSRRFLPRARRRPRRPPAHHPPTVLHHMGIL
ncbi:hypothetical protein BJ912DRAFT_1067935 [Pholiota molesta]|nr:hypothetical protein BJ912DRAFT_1067935 [Pholiota molesta]